MKTPMLTQVKMTLGTAARGKAPLALALAVGLAALNAQAGYCINPQPLPPGGGHVHMSILEAIFAFFRFR